MKRIIIINILLLAIIIKIPIEKEIIEASESNIKEQKQEQVITPIATTRNLETTREKNKPIVKTSQQGIELIKKYEGCKLNSYKLPNEKNYTIGYGHYSSENYVGQQITQVQAENLLKNDLERFERYVSSKCSHLNLTQNEFDALVSFTFNCGEGNLNKLIKNRNKEQIADRLVNYTNSGSIKNKKGLQRRRNEEKKLFKGGNI